MDISGTFSTLATAWDGLAGFAGAMGCKPEGVSAMMWKCDVGGGPITDGLESGSTW